MHTFQIKFWDQLILLNSNSKYIFLIYKREFICPLRVVCTSLYTKSMKCFDSWIISTPTEWKMIVLTTTKHYYSGRNTLWISSKKEDNISVDTGGLMKLITPFTILNQNFHEIDLIRDAMKNRKLAKERLHEEYRNRKMYKYHQFA